MGNEETSEAPTYVLERTFAAPRELVWKTWTDPRLLPRWYGPGVETIAAAPRHGQGLEAHQDLSPRAARYCL